MKEAPTVFLRALCFLGSFPVRAKPRIFFRMIQWNIKLYNIIHTSINDWIHLHNESNRFYFVICQLHQWKFSPKQVRTVWTSTFEKQSFFIFVKNNFDSEWKSMLIHGIKGKITNLFQWNFECNKTCSIDWFTDTVVVVPSAYQIKNK